MLLFICFAEWSLGAVLYEDELAAINACGIVPVTGEVRSAAASRVSTCVTPLFLLYTLVYCIVQRIGRPVCCAT